MSSARRLRSITPLLPCLRALWDFEKLQNRMPGSAGTTEEMTSDIKEFTRLATEKTRELQLGPDLLKSDFLRTFMQNLGSELAMTTSFVGAAAAQDIGNVLMGKDQPIQNMMLFDGESSIAPVYALTPIVPA